MTAIPGPCLVEKGPGTGKPCVFPFLWEYDSVLYTGCAFDKSRDIAPWCSTKVSTELFIKSVYEMIFFGKILIDRIIEHF